MSTSQATSLISPQSPAQAACGRHAITSLRCNQTGGEGNSYLSSQFSSETGDVRERETMRAILFVLLKHFLVMTKGETSIVNKTLKCTQNLLVSGYSLTFDVILKLDKEAQEFLVDSLANYRQQQSESSIEVS